MAVARNRMRVTTIHDLRAEMQSPLAIGAETGWRVRDLAGLSGPVPSADPLSRGAPARAILP